MILKDSISAPVIYKEEEKLYYISYPDLNILVWGNDREEAEEAFQFNFISFIKTIYNEDDSNLTNKAREIKKKLTNLIDQIK